MGTASPTEGASEGAGGGVRRVLLLGSSEVQFSESGPPGALPALLQAALEVRSPRWRWRVEGTLLYVSENMPERGLDVVRTFRPDVVLVFLGSHPVGEESVIFKIRARWPALYRPAHRLVELWKRAAGGPPAGYRTRKGLLFRAPRALARRLVGTAPRISLEAGIAATSQTLSSLAAVPGLCLVCRLATPNHQDPRQTEEVNRRTAALNQAVGDQCDALGIRYFDPRGLFHARGQAYVLGPDGLHADRRTREGAAEDAAIQVLGALGFDGPESQ